MKRIGLVGGISWVSTLDYYRLINEGVNRRLGGLQFAECLVDSLNFGELQARGWPNAYDLLLGACERLKRGGAEAIALGANTAHLFADALEEAVQLPLIHIGTETGKAVRAAGLKKVALLGTAFTLELGFYRDKLAAFGLEVLVPEPRAERDRLQHILKEELGQGLVVEASRQALLRMGEDLLGRGAEGIILGCTELPLILGAADFPVPVFDTTRIHAGAIVDFALS